MSNISPESRQELQHAVDVAYETRTCRQPEAVRLDLIARVARLELELDIEDIDGWALDITEGHRIQIRIK